MHLHTLLSGCILHAAHLTSIFCQQLLGTLIYFVHGGHISREKKTKRACLGSVEGGIHILHSSHQLPTYVTIHILQYTYIYIIE
jgi:hypothetical protein